MEIMFMIAQPENLTIGANIHPMTLLIDTRQKTAGIEFGSVTQVASQYGINVTRGKTYTKFSGPKSRLQMFAQKLHFAGVRYFEL